MFAKERLQWMALIENERDAIRQEREAWHLERQELLNRIQRPEFTRTDPPAAEVRTDYTGDHGMTQDDLELAYIGREVPDGVTLGSLRVDEPTG